MAPEAHQIDLAMGEKKSLSSEWFRVLRDDICAAFEGIEDLVSTPESLLDVLNAKAGIEMAVAAAKSVSCVARFLKRLE